MPDNSGYSEMFLALTIIGALMSVWKMTMLAAERRYTVWGRRAYRTALAAISVGFLMAARFTETNAWVPLSPCLLGVISLDLWLAFRIGRAYGLSASERPSAADDSAISIFPQRRWDRDPMPWQPSVPSVAASLSEQGRNTDHARRANGS